MLGAREADMGVRELLLAGVAAAAAGCGSGGASAPGGALENAPCAGVMCGAAPPAVTLNVVDAVGSGPVAGVAVENATTPPPNPPSYQPHPVCGPAADRTVCQLDAGAPGTYALDLAAPGCVTQHVVVEVPAHAHVIGACCELGYVPQTVEVRLVPLG
jgi:hypothetical protein